MDVFALLSHRTLPAEHRLNAKSCCPTMDLAVFISPSATPLAAPGTAEPKRPSFDTLSCYRLGTPTPQVWSVAVNQLFTASTAACDPIGHYVPVDPVARFDQITALHWSPDGHCLAAALSSSSGTRPPSFVVLSVHNGQLLGHPTVILDEFAVANPSSPIPQDPSGRSINFAAWLSLDFPNESSPASQRPKSIGQSICDKLPANMFVRPMMDLEMMKNVVGADYAARPGGTAHHPFSAIQFPPSIIQDGHSLVKPGVSSLLILSSHINRIHFFVNGTVYLGSTTLPDQAQLKSARLMAMDSADLPDSARIPATHLGAIRLQLFWLKLDGIITYGYLDLRPACLPLERSLYNPSLYEKAFLSKPTLAVLGIRSEELHEQIHLSHSVHGLLRDCFFGYFSIVKDWHLCRSGTHKWYENFAEIAKAHDVLAPLTFQMLELLFAGQASEGLRDFLSTKTAERFFSKWEFTTISSLSRMRGALLELLIPNLERLFVWVTELRTHAYPDVLQSKLIEESDLEDLLLVEELIKDLLKCVHDLDQKLMQEDRTFKEFCKWLRSEFEFVIALETAAGAVIRPPITYDFMVVSQFIKRAAANELDGLIFSRPMCMDSLRPTLELQKQKLAQRYHDDLLDIEGPEKRKQNRNRLDVLLDQVGGRVRDEPPSDPSSASRTESKPTMASFATPDTSHFQMNLNDQFQTPSILDHLKAQNETSCTPSNAPPQRSSPPLEIPTPEQITLQLNAKEGMVPLTSFGIYGNLMYCTSHLSNVLTRMFGRIGSEKTIHVCEREEAFPAKHRSSNTHKDFFCAHHVDAYQYFAYLSSEQQINIHRIKVKEPSDQSQAFEEAHASIVAQIAGSGDDESSKLEQVTIIDMGFFDDLELVFLGQMGTGIATRYALITIRYTHLFNEKAGVQMEYLPVYRFHQLQSEYPPEQISLNGLKGRRMGCVIAGKGRILHVFDMEDLGGSEGIGDSSDCDEVMKD